MARFSFVTIDVFTDVRFGGNPLAVFPDAVGIGDADMQRIAREFNLSETSFVLPADDAANSARVRIFNPDHEMGFAGHPNVGTALVLDAMGRAADGVLLFEEGAGLVRVTLDRSGAHVLATVDAPEALSTAATLPVAAVAACLSLGEDDIITAAHPPITASVGYPFLLVEVTAAALGRATPDASAFRAHSPDGRLSIHLYAHAGKDRIAARMFAPLLGIAEDPATGSANAALGALLLSLEGGDARRWSVTQGDEMGRPSRIALRAWRAGQAFRASIGGGGVPVTRGEIQLD